MKVPLGPVWKNLKNKEDNYILSTKCRPSTLTEEDNLDRTRAFQVYDHRDVRIVLVLVEELSKVVTVTVAVFLPLTSNLAAHFALALTKKNKKEPKKKNSKLSFSIICHLPNMIAPNKIAIKKLSFEKRFCLYLFFRP